MDESKISYEINHITISPAPITMTATHQCNFDRFFNSQRLCDVMFVFPSEPTKPVIYGHKIMFANVSSVFDRMFSGNFPKDHVISIEDIKHDIFLEMVRYIYTGQYQITKANMAELLYTVQKYMLDEVKAQIEDYVLANISSENLLEIMNACVLFERKEIVEKCCFMFCDDPLNFINSETWFELSPWALKLIVSQRQMNCTNQQLREFAAAWQAKNQREPIVFSEQDLRTKPFLNLKTEYFSGNFQSQHYEHVALGLRVETPTYVHGIGFYLGIQTNSDQHNDQNFRERVAISIWDMASHNKKLIIGKTIIVAQQPSIFIEYLMFEKKVLSGNNIVIQIVFQRKECRPCFTSQNAPSTDGNFYLYRVPTKTNTCTPASGGHCFAYLLTSEVKTSP
jgi:BTB/POZ domain